MIDLTQPINSQIIVQAISNARPEGVKGILETVEVQVPEFDSGCWFVGDAGEEKWPNYFNRILPYTFGKAFGDVMFGAHFVIFKLTDGGYLSLLAMPSAKTISCFSVAEGNRLMLNVATLGTAELSGDVPILCSTCDANPYDAFRECWTKAVTHLGTTKFRHEKAYAELFEYLGWCSWEQYHRDIDEIILISAMKALEESPLPIRWFLVDDGHEELNDRGLRSFAPSSEKLPNGWETLKALRSDDGIRWLGLWHHTSGYWGGLSEDNDFGELDEHLTKLPSGTYLNKPTADSADAFYDAYIGSAREYGFDFVKIDDQSHTTEFYRDTENAAEATTFSMQALQRAVSKHDLPLINCMAHNSICIFNTLHSNVTRCSIDYFFGKLSSAKSHIWQSYQNMIWFGHTVWGDHDMFHSSDPHCGRLMAISKAMSGAPVYMSDAPEDLVDDFITPLCFNDGKLLRPLAPAIPLPESLWIDPMQEEKPYRVIAPLSYGAVAIVNYNLVDKDESTIRGYVHAEDYCDAGHMIQPYAGKWDMPPEGLFLYDWHKQTGQIMDGSYEFELTNFDDRLLYLIPIVNGWAVVGPTDKYLAPAAIASVDAAPGCLSVMLKESVSFAFFAPNTPTCTSGTISQVGNLYVCTPDKGTLSLTISC